MAWESRNLFNRRFNLGLNQEDAYVSGYFGVYFQFSSNVSNNINKIIEMTTPGPKPFDAEELGRVLSASAEGVSALPGGTLNMAIMTAMGGAKWGAPTSVDFGDLVTIKFRELMGLPIKKLITGWTNLVRHTNTGLSPLNTDGGTGDKYTKTQFSADCIYWTTKPNGRDVEFACSLNGIYSMSDLSSQMTADLATVDGQTFDVNFHVDSIYWDHKVKEIAQNLIEAFHANGVKEYYNRK